MNLRTKAATLATCALALAGFSATGHTQQSPAHQKMSFFITSSGLGDGANLGGLTGADKHCQALAQDVGAGKRKWHAYLSTSATDKQPAVNARDRIGQGPWYNAKGVLVARNVDELHSGNQINKQTALNEKGEIVNGRTDKPNMHDILTGSDSQGMAFPGGQDTTCGNWTKNAEGSAQVGHHDRQGLNDKPPALSWNHAHPSRGCSQDGLRSSGGNGYFYCFATR